MPWRAIPCMNIYKKPIDRQDIVACIDAGNGVTLIHGAITKFTT